VNENEELKSNLSYRKMARELAETKVKLAMMYFERHHYTMAKIELWAAVNWLTQAEIDEQKEKDEQAG
jgi:Tfp pilus assembly protein PilF